MAFLSNINFSFLLLMLYFLFEITYKFLGSISVFKNTAVDKPTIIPINVARITHLRMLINNTVSSLKTFFIIKNYTYSLQALFRLTAERI
jgi:hypothetical protein